MADDFDALRTINAHAGDLDAERAARMRSRALAGVFGDAPAGDATTSVLTEEPESRPSADRPAHAERRRRPDRADHVLRLVPDGPTTEIRLDHPEEQDVIHLDGDRRGQTGRRPFVVAAAAAAVIALVIGVAVTRSGQRDTVMADQPTPTSVAEIAANAATLVDRPLAPGEYAYLATERGYPFAVAGEPEVTHAAVYESWTSAAGDGRNRNSAIEVVEGRTPVDTFDQATDTGPIAGIATFGGFTYDELRSLPTDPAALREALASVDTTKTADYARSGLITDLLTFDVTPPGVRAAALAILAEDGATVVPDAVDRDGHTGLGIVLDRPDGFTSVYVVTRDGLLLGAYDIITGDELTPDRAVVWSTPRDQRRVTSTG